MKIISFSLFLLFLWFPSASLGDSKCHPSDKRVLLQMKKILHNAELWSNWDPKTDCCNWYFVLCNSKTHRVDNLGFAGKVNGPIPDIVGDLSYLEVLQCVAVRNVTGGIPPTIGKLKHLRFLSLEGAELTGPIPSAIGDLKYLDYLDLSSNQLTGPIPPSLSRLTRIRTLKLDHNILTGQIPESFGNFTKSRGPLLYLNDNQLSGPIPKSLGGATFGYIDISGNNLEGDASFLFGADKRVLDYANLSRNSFEFSLSEVVFPRKLRWLDLSHNKIYGSLPPGLAELELREFNVSYNQLCGQIPVSEYLQNFDPSAYSHNKCLCGAPLPPCGDKSRQTGTNFSG